MCLYPVNLYNVYNKKMQVPCGKCIECEQHKSIEWTHRVLLEARGKESCFITLTYDNEHKPLDNSIVKSDLQKFFKRFRKAHQNDENFTIKYLACGEYGSKKGRPHYHAIIIGYRFENDKINEYGKEVCSELEKLWYKGFHLVLDTCFEAIKYVCKYAQKQVFNEKLDDLSIALDGRKVAFFEKYDLQPPFLLMSKGLGYDEFAKNPNFASGKIYNDGHYISIPRYFLDRYEKETGLCLDDLRQKRVEIASQNVKSFDEIKKHREITKKRLTKLSAKTYNLSNSYLTFRKRLQTFTNVFD